MTVTRQPTRPTPARAPNKYAGIQAAQPRDPILGLGEHYLTLVEISASEARDYEIVTFDVTSSSDPKFEGTRAKCLFACTGKAGRVGLKELKALCIAICGYESEDEYNAAEADSPGALMTAVIEDHAGEGRTVLVSVTQGKARINQETGQPTGEFFANYRWSVDPDQEALGL